MEKEDLVDELKAYLQSIGWETLEAEVVVNGIVEGFESDLLSSDLASYNELAQSQGVGVPPPFDEQAVTLLDRIREM